jgi:CDP-4-dehydro-6-deoxyglucose reductase
VTERVSLSRAAQLLGTSRAALQGKIREGLLPAFDGEVSLADLHRLYPDLEVEDSGAYEKVSDIKKHAFGRRILERALPSQEALAMRIFHQSEELAAVRRHLEQYHALVESMRGALESAPPGALRDAMLTRLRDGLAAILAHDQDDSLETMQNILRVVAAQVTVRPSGHQFLVEGNDSLLQAGLKAGLRLPYGCGAGSCGLCKARVIAGEVRQIAHADYPLSEAERQSGVVLTCSCAPAGDLTLEVLEARDAGDIPRQEIVATLRKIETLAESTLLLHLQTPRSNRLRFLAGQSVTLGLTVNGTDISATLPIASCPCDDRNLHFHLDRDGGDLARLAFAGRLKAGEPINLRGPSGDFVVHGEGTRPFVFIAADMGFAPVKSLIEHAMAIDDNDRFALIWSVSRPDGAYLDKLCRMWAQAFDDFLYLPIVSHPPADAAANAAATARTVPFLAEADVFVAGPEDFAAEVTAALQFGGVPAGRLRSFAI